MSKRVRIEYTRRECVIVLNVLSKALLREIPRQIYDPALASALAKTAKAREQWNHVPEGEEK